MIIFDSFKRIAHFLSVPSLPAEYRAQGPYFEARKHHSSPFKLTSSPLSSGRYDPQPYHGQPISQQPSLPPLPSNSASDSDSIAKPAWEFDAPSMHESFVDGEFSRSNADIWV